MKKAASGIVGALALLGPTDPRSAQAQQAIVSLPSADVTEEGRAFVMHETQLRPWSKPYWNTTHFFTYGLGRHTELAITFFNLGIPETRNTSMALGFKSAFPLLDEERSRWALRLVLGGMLLVSFNDGGIGYWNYGLLVLTLPRVQTRIGAGVHLASKQLQEKDAVSFMGSIEQPIPGVHGLTAVAEWFSGDHDLSNLIVGVCYHPNPTWIFVLGYKMPTQSWDAFHQKHGFVAEVGAFFGAPARHH